MSITSLCSRDSITITRLTTTRGTAGGQVRTYTTAARGSLTTSINCRIQSLSADERREYGIRAERDAWALYFSSNPSLTVQDQVAFTDADSNAVTARVIGPSRQADNQSRLWKGVVEEVGNEQ